MAAPITTTGFDAFWQFAAERQQVYLRRLRGGAARRMDDDPVIAAHRFTNCYRASDRVSQYLIGAVQDDDRWSWEDTFARTMLFKMFNRVSTWRHLLAVTGEPDADMVADRRLEDALSSVAGPLYSAAYVMPPPAGEGPKYSRHLRLLRRMLQDGAAQEIACAASMRAAYEVLRSYDSIGDFLAYQYITDLNYCARLAFSEDSFTVPGPGSRRGLRKCFSDPAGLTEADLIRWTRDRQNEEFDRRGLAWEGLWGRDLRLIDIQNLFCETDKYTRVAMPHLAERAAGERIKQRYRPDAEPLTAWFPPKWGINHRIAADSSVPAVACRRVAAPARVHP